MKKGLLEKIQNRSARLAVVGLGYVGLPLALRRFDYELILKNSPLIVDTRGRYLEPPDHVVKA